MLFNNNTHPGSLAHAMRLQGTLAIMDDSVRGYIYEQLKEAEIELHIQQAASRQLDAELQADIHRDHKDGTNASALYQRLPPEIRAHIFSYVVTTDKSVHIFPPKGNENHGYRLSLCDESSYDFDLGHCRCDDSRARGHVTSNFFDNAIFLVSRRVRREALDAFFLTNSFTFTCLYELVRFTGSFKTSCSKMQRIRIFERVDDYPNSDFRVKGIQKARQRLKALKHLDLYVFLSTWSAYESLHEDGLVNQLLHFAMGPQPPIVARKPVEITTTRKRLASECSDEDSINTDSKKVKKTDMSSELDETVEEVIPVTTVERTEKGEPATVDQDETEPLVSSPTTSEMALDYLNDVSRGPYDTAISSACADPSPDRMNAMPPSTPVPDTPTTTKTTTKTETPFPIPPLKSFKANVRLRNLSIPLRGRPENGSRAEYYANLYTRLTDHLTDVFMDNGKKYKSVTDVPSLGPMPNRKIRDDERAPTGPDKRGILFLKD